MDLSTSPGGGCIRPSPCVGPVGIEPTLTRCKPSGRTTIPSRSLARGDHGPVGPSHGERCLLIQPGDVLKSGPEAQRILRSGLDLEGMAEQSPILFLLVRLTKLYEVGPAGLAVKSAGLARGDGFDSYRSHAR